MHNFVNLHLCNFFFFFDVLQMWMSVRQELQCVPGSGNVLTPSGATSASATKALTCNTSTGNTNA